MAKFDLPPQDIPLVDVKTGRMNLDWYDKLSKLQIVPDPIGPPKLVTFTRVMSLASGNQSVTGLGFQPRSIHWLTAVAAALSPYGSVGFSDGITNQCSETGPGFVTPEIGIAGITRDTGGAGANFNQFTLVSFDSDGFTVAWQKLGAPVQTATVIALCYR